MLSISNVFRRCSFSIHMGLMSNDHIPHEHITKYLLLTPVSNYLASYVAICYGCMK